MSIPVGYVSGKYNDDSQEQVEANVADAALCGAKLIKMGYAAVVPHCNCHLPSQFCYPPVPDEEWLKVCLSLMERCDFVVLIPGWEDSPGAQVEVEHAHKCGIPVFGWNFIPDLHEWEEDPDVMGMRRRMLV
jgi:hypothetical protein